MSDEITLRVAGARYAYWKSASIVTSIETISGEFALQFADRWSQDAERLPFSEGDECEVWLGNELVIAGYIDDLSSSISATETVDSLSGRDFTGDLVDCSAENAPDEFKDINLFDLATKLCEPFGIHVVNQAEIGNKFLVYKLQHGERVFDALERAARMRGVLLVSNKKRGLLLTTPGVGKISEPLALGDNIISAEKTSSYANRYSRYTVKGQQGGIELDGYAGSAKSTAGQATDEVIERFRPLTVLAENQASQGDCQTRAQWESTTRAARSLSLGVTVQGWKTRAGVLWEPNNLVSVSIPRLSIDTELLISSCNYRITGEGGSITVLGLVDKKAFTLRPQIKTDYKAESL